MVWNYSKKVKELFMNTIEGKSSHIGSHEEPDGKGFHGSLVCGDAISLSFITDKANNPLDEKITELKYKTFGCTSAIASSEALALIVEEGKLNPIDAAKVSKAQIVEFLDGLPQQKIHCSIMGVEALQDAVKDWARKRGISLKEHDLEFLEDKKEITENPEDNKIVCECKGLTRGFLKDQIKDFEITTLDDLMEKTGAGTVCGSCIDREGGLRDILMEANKGVNKKTTPKKNIDGGSKMTENVKNETQEKTHDQIAKEIETVLSNEIAPMLGYDNGGIEVVEIKNKVLYFRLEGACSTCSVSDYTVDAIRDTLKKKVDEGIEVQRVW